MLCVCSFATGYGSGENEAGFFFNLPEAVMFWHVWAICDPIFIHFVLSWTPAKKQTFTQCRFNVGTPSATLVQSATLVHHCTLRVPITSMAVFAILICSSDKKVIIFYSLWNLWETIATFRPAFNRSWSRNDHCVNRFPQVSKRVKCIHFLHE